MRNWCSASRLINARNAFGRQILRFGTMTRSFAWRTRPSFLRRRLPILKIQRQAMLVGLSGFAQDLFNAVAFKERAFAWRAGGCVQTM